MKRFIGLLIISLFIASGALAEDKVIKMSTTTSTQASGLLDELLPAFQKDTGIAVKVFAKGTGAAVQDGMDGNVDVIFVHARAKEDKFVADGYAEKRFAVMHNDFVLLGPASDPAGIKGVKSAAEALKKIAASQSSFVSRGDDSGTHVKEQELWKESGVPVKAEETKLVKEGKEKTIKSTAPADMGGRYLSIGQGMDKVLTFAEEKGAYTLSDRGTYIKFKFGRPQGLALEVLCEGDPALFNPYGVLPVSPKKFPHVKYDLAKQFAKWLVSEKGQSLIANYKIEGKQLFFPDALPNVK